jgi:two-component system, NarL family, nitrate/nitrite response regulator NarL
VRSTSAKSKIRVLLVDDHLIIRQGIRSTFKSHSLITVVGDAANGSEAIAKTKALAPDVVLMDINMPEMNGLDATVILRQEFPNVKVVALTVHDSREYVLQILRSGAHGYVLKDASPEELSRAIQAVCSGHSFLSPSVTNIVLHDFLGSTSGGSDPGGSGLSAREMDVLRMIVKGRTTKEIASQINIGIRTVETYRARLMRKLNVRNAAELTRTALARQLVEV